MSKCSKIILFIAIILITNITTLISAVYLSSYLSVGTTFNTNLKYTEQIDFLLNSIVLRLKNNDPTLLKDLSAFSEEYQASYEGQRFMEMAKKYFKQEFNEKNFAHQPQYHQKK